MHTNGALQGLDRPLVIIEPSKPVNFFYFLGIFVPAIAVPIAIGVVLFVTIAIVIKCVKMKRRRSTGQDYNTEYPLLIEPDDDDEMINLAGDDNPAATATA